MPRQLFELVILACLPFGLSTYWSPVSCRNVDRRTGKVRRSDPRPTFYHCAARLTLVRRIRNRSSAAAVQTIKDAIGFLTRLRQFACIVNARLGLSPSGHVYRRPTAAVDSMPPGQSCANRAFHCSNTLSTILSITSLLEQYRKLYREFSNHYGLFFDAALRCHNDVILTSFSGYLFTMLVSFVHVKRGHTAHGQQLNCCVKKCQIFLRSTCALQIHVQLRSQSCGL